MARPFRAFPGVQFPQTGEQEGKRSSTQIGAKIIETVMLGMEEPQLALKVAKTGAKGWRYGYSKHYKKMVTTMLSDPGKALAGAKAGVEYMHNNFTFVPAKADGSCDWANECTMQEEMDKFNPKKAELKFIPLVATEDKPDFSGACDELRRAVRMACVASSNLLRFPRSSPPRRCRR